MMRNWIPTILFLSLISGSQTETIAQSRRMTSFRLDSQAAVTSQPPSNSVSHVTLDAQNLWIGTGKGAAKSTDGGMSWANYRTDPAFANDGIFSIVARQDTAWISTGFDKAVDGGTVQTGSGYTFSTDGGAHWQHRGQALDVRGDSLVSYGINDSLFILPVVVPEQNVTFDIALGQGTVWIASWASGLRKSTDMGQTWQRVLLPTDNRSELRPTDTLWSYANNDTLRQRRIFQRLDPRRNNNMLAFSVLVLGDTVWCGTAGGINKSVDGGVSWIRFTHTNESSPILGNWVIALDAQRLASGTRIWSTNWQASDPDEEYGVSYSDDGGTTWKNLLRGIKAYDFAFQDSITYIATAEGIFRTSDGGATLAQISTIVDADPRVRQLVNTSTVFAAAVTGDTLILGTADGIAIGADNAAAPFGSAWKILRSYQPVAASGETYAYPNPFSPAFDLTRIHYGTVAGVTNPLTERTVRIEIFDFGMNRVRTLLNDAKRSAALEMDELWDGRNDDGKIVANGVYFYRIVVNSADPLFGKILVLQ